MAPPTLEVGAFPWKILDPPLILLWAALVHKLFDVRTVIYFYLLMTHSVTIYFVNIFV